MKYLTKETYASGHSTQHIRPNKEDVIHYLRLLLDINQTEYHPLIEEFDNTGKLDFHLIKRNRSIYHVQIVPLWEV